MIDNMEVLPMLKKLKDFFKTEKQTDVSIGVDRDGAVVGDELVLATIVMMVEMAAADREIAREEAEAVCSLIGTQFAVDDAKIPSLVEYAISSRRESGRIDEFVNTINQHFSRPQRQKVLAMIWKVIIADGRIDKFEQRFATQIKFRFQLSDDEADEARNMAEDGRV